MEIVVHRGDPFRRLDDAGRIVRQPRAIVAGQLDRPLDLLPGDEVDVLGIRFTPAGAAAFIDMPLSRLAGTTPALEDVAGSFGRDLAAAVLGAGERDEPVRRAETLLRRRVSARRAADVDPLRRCVDHVLERRGRVSAGTLARLTGWSLRHLERRFAEQVGLDPNTFGRIVRFQSVLAARARHPEWSWADLAHECGYCDQSHMIRDFRRFAGDTPAGWDAGEHPMGDAFLASV